jgi:alpha/beta hydrolase family protein
MSASPRFKKTPEAVRQRLLRASIIAALAAAGTLTAAAPADARITRITVTTYESPTFGGYSWPGVGQYEKIAGKAYGEIDPNNPQNAVITDLALAPRNANGNVEYAFDYYVLKPIDLSKGAHKMMYEPPNRGSKFWGSFDRMTGGNDPGAVTDPAVLANTFLQPRGYTLVWSGWDASAGTNNAAFKTTITLPVAVNPDGTAITGPGYEYFLSSGTSYTLNYPAATLDQTTATLTHRVHLDDTPEVIPASGWAYNADGTAISLAGGASFVGNDIYEFTYTAKNPTVNGVGFAAVRDFNAWLRYSPSDDIGTPNPFINDVQRVYTDTLSQPARLLNDFTNLGFNQAENGKKVFDGMLQWIGAGDGVNMNYRWSQPGRTNRNRQDLRFLEGLFPWANVTTTDPISGKTASRYDRCTTSNTCPYAMEIYSANEYWVKAASLMTTTPDGKADLALDTSPYARNYFISSHQHGTGNATSKGACQQFQNPLDSAPIQRALWIAMDDWVTKGVAPPPSQVPKLADGTLVAPDQKSTGFPNIPGVTYTGLKTTRYRFDLGPNFYTTGIPTVNPPAFTSPYEDNPANGPIYPSFVPKTDADGNDIAGVRLPDVTVPLGTYTGWALRAGAWANDGCEGSGQYIPFPATAADRMASGDPRRSIEERYPTSSSYYYAVLGAVNNFVANRWMLPEDAPTALNRMLNAGSATGVIKRDPAFTKMLQNADTPLDQGFGAVSTVAPQAVRAQ